MEIKGTAVLSIQKFVKQRFGDRYNEWFASLPATSKEIFKDDVNPSLWLGIEHAAVAPTESIAKLFYGFDSKKAAIESGRFGAEMALTGLYKFFVKAASPAFIITRASYVFSTYYRPCKIAVVDKGDHSVYLHMTELNKSDEIIENRIAGWMEKALELSGCKDLRITTPKSFTKGHAHTEYDIKWK